MLEGCYSFCCGTGGQEEVKAKGRDDSAVEQTAAQCHQFRNTIFSNALVGGVIGFSAICLSVLPYVVNGAMYAGSLGAPPPQLAIAVIGFIAIGIILGAIYGLMKGICDLCIQWKEIK